jgi:hypothetical protein
MKVFWDITPFNLIEIDRRFRGTDSIIRTINVLMMEAVCTSETSVYFNETKRRSQKTYCRENVKYNISG